MSNTTLGDRLYRIVSNTQTMFFKLGEFSQLAHEAYELAAKAIDARADATITFNYPIGVRPDGQPMVGESSYEKSALIQHYAYLAKTQLPINGIYQLVTGMEALFSDVVREIVLAYPKKIGKKRTVPASLLLSCDTIESAHLAIVDSMLHELTYKSPKDFTEAVNPIISCNLLEIPAYHRYIEVKATRDIYIHNGGIANQVYMEKSGSHARVKAGNPLPVDISYFLSAYETCLQITDVLLGEFNKQWPSSEYEAFKARQKVKLSQIK